MAKDDPTYGLQQNPQGFRGEDSQQALVTNPWIQTARLIASDASPSNLFGASVAMNGSTLIVGAPYRNGDRGAAYVFVKSGGTWIQQAELTSSDGGELDHFGTSVAVSGTTVIVGAPYHTVGSNNEQGAAYVFVKSGETWIQQAELTASDGAIFDNTLSTAPSNLSMAPGGHTTSTITVTPFNGFSGSVSLVASGTIGVAGTFNPNPTTGTSTLTLTASATAKEGTAQMVVTGTSGTLTKTTPLIVTVLPAPEVTIVPPYLNFANQVINTTSPARPITIRNIGQATLKFTGPSIITPPTNFKVSIDRCGQVFPNQSCQVYVEFNPTALGKLTAALSFTDDASNSPQSMTLSGLGVEPATLTPASVAYSMQKVGTSSAPKTFTLTNNQWADLTSIAISTTGDFALSATTCGTTLAAKSRCTISITFAPTQKGTRTGQLIVKDSASNSPQLSDLKGTGN